VAVTSELLDRAAIERLLRIGGAALARRMIDLFLAEGPQKLRALEAAVEAGTIERVERGAHALKSSAGNLGALQVWRLAEALELEAMAGSVDPESVRTLRDAWNATEVEVSALRRELLA
jgi:HPt (histidine-containing phosphotransfer) domain-containing protein